MKMTSWISSSIERLTRSQQRGRLRRVPNRQSHRAAIVETLEQRRLLSAVAVAALPTDLTLGGIGQTTTFDQGTAATAVAPNLTLTAPIGDQITGATVSFTNWQAEDRLTFTNPAGIQGTFTQDLNTHTATLTFTGNASAADYQMALQSVSYQDVAANPVTSVIREATITVNDATSSVSGTQDVMTVAILGGLNKTDTFVHGQSPIAVMPNLVITIPSTQNVTSATVQFTNFQSADRVTLTNSAGLQHTLTINHKTHTATLTLTGVASASVYQTALRSVTFSDVSAHPNITAVRNATVTLNAGQFSSTSNQKIQVATVFEGIDHRTTFNTGSDPISLFPDVKVTLPTGVNATGATLTFHDWQVGQDVLKVGSVPGLHTTITENQKNHTITLTITGTASAAAYQTLLRSIRYQNTSGHPHPGTRPGTLTLHYGHTTVTAHENVRVVHHGGGGGGGGGGNGGDQND